MATTSMTFRLEEKLKSQADTMFQSMGMDTSTAIKMFLQRFVDTGTFPFTPEITDPFYSKENIEYLMQAKRSFENGDVSEHSLIELEELK